MTFPPGGPAHALSAAADEALTEASFRSGEFAEAERLFAEARAVAAGEGDRAARRSPSAVWPWRSTTATSASWLPAWNWPRGTWPPRKS